MAEISIDRAAFEKFEAGDFSAVDGDERVASFLANKFREGEAEVQAQDRLPGEEPSWVYNFWTWTF